MGREKDYRVASKYFDLIQENEELEKRIREKNEDIRSISDPDYYLNSLDRARVLGLEATPQITPQLPPMLAPKVSREQARKNIAAFNRGAEAAPKVVHNYISKTSPREMLADGRDLIVDTVQGVAEDPGGAVLDALPIVSTYRAYKESDRLNELASDARKAGDLETAEKLEALSAYSTTTGTLGVLPAFGLLRRVSRAIPVGEPEVPARFLIKKPKPVPNPETVNRAIDQGFTPLKAEYLGLPYDGMGEHFIPRDLGDKLHIPDWYMNSRFNVLKPKGISIGDMYELHYRVDPSFHGTNLPWRSSAGGGGRWIGAELGIKKYGLGGRLWHGSPRDLKYGVGLLGTGGYLLLNDDD